MNKIKMCILLEKQILSDDPVSTIYCGITNHPKTWWLKIIIYSTWINLADIILSEIS